MIEYAGNRGSFIQLISINSVVNEGGGKRKKKKIVGKCLVLFVNHETVKFVTGTHDKQQFQLSRFLLCNASHFYQRVDSTSHQV